MTELLTMRSPRVAEILRHSASARLAAEQTKAWATQRVAFAPPAMSICDRFSDGAWRGQRCFIVGGGPSLKGFDFGRLRGERVIAINKAFKDVPFADIMFAMDRPLLDLITSGQLGEDYRAALDSFWGVKLWLDLSGYAYPPDVYSVKSAGETGWTDSLSKGLYHGQNSGYGALNLALVLGADPIYLLGYDCQRGPEGEKNYHSGYPTGSSPDAMNIFLKAFEAGAEKLKAISHSRIVNLNPNSALKCFEFGDADKVLAASRPSTGGITVITPTGDRPLAFALCQQWMAHQTRKPDQWIVVDDGKVPLMPAYGMTYVRREPRPDDPQHTLALNMQAALSHIKGDKILICEDDEYYAPGYIEEMARRLDQAEVVGICRAKYYHLPTGGYVQIGNTGHASLAETGFRKSFLPVVAECTKRGIVPHYLDEQIWRIVNESKRTGRKIPSHLFVDDTTPLYVGIKGLPGRAGIGQGHNPAMYHNHLDAAGRPVLKQWIPKDHQIYMDILSGKLTSENFASYFPAAPLPITGITVCWNTKDLIERSYNSIRKFYPTMPIIIIDGSDAGDPCAAYVRGLASDITTVIQPGCNIGHGRGMCLGIDKVKTPYALIFDSDIELLEPCVAAMLAMMEADTFGVGHTEKIGYDGFVYGVHPHPEGPLTCLHPYFHLIDVGNYKKYYPYVHHGMPVYMTMLDIHKRGLSEKIIKQFPGLVNHGPDSKLVRHDTGKGTGDRRKAKGLSHIEGPWVRNRGQV